MNLGQHGTPYCAPHLPLGKADTPANSLGSLYEGNTASANSRKETVAIPPLTVVAALAERPQRLWTSSLSEQPRVGHSSAKTKPKAVDPRTALYEQEGPRGVCTVTAYACKLSQSLQKATS